MRKTGFASFFAAVLFALAGQAHAATFDFTPYGTENGQGILASNVLALPGGTFSNADGRLFARGPLMDDGGIILAPLGSICGLPQVGYHCRLDLLLEFDAPVSNFSVETFFFEFNDEVTITIFGALGELASQVITSATVVNFGAISGITSVLFDDDSAQGKGFQYGNFSFDVTPVPLPAAAPLFAAGLGLIGFAARRRRLRVAA
jgi:hypothetical protein